jgi:acetyl esterase/lipase
VRDQTNDGEEFETPDAIARRPRDPLGTSSSRTVPDIAYAVVEGYRPLRLDLHLPSSGDAPYPVVVSIHGGGWIAGSNKLESDEYVTIAQMWRALLDCGVAVAAVQYRLSGEALFPAALHDVRAAVRWLRAFGADLGVDPERIAAFGDSAGGHLSALLAVYADGEGLEGDVGVPYGSSRVAAAVAWYPLTDLETVESESYDWSSPSSMGARLIGADRATHPDAARAASPITYVDSASAPLLVQHGDIDYLVPHHQSLDLAARYRAAGVEVEVDIVPGADHGFDGGDMDAIVERAAAFLARQLGVDRRPAPAAAASRSTRLTEGAP